MAEEFGLKFANLLGSTQGVAAEFSRYQLRPSWLHFTTTELGAGVVGQVVLAHFAAPAYHVGWKVLQRCGDASQAGGAGLFFFGWQRKQAAPLVAVKQLHAGADVGLLRQ